MRVTNLLSAAVIVDLTFDRLASNLVVFRISEESRLARANSNVIIRFALGVASTEEQIASFLTFCLSNVVLDASFVVRTVVVGYAT